MLHPGQIITIPQQIFNGVLLDTRHSPCWEDPRSFNVASHVSPGDRVKVLVIRYETEIKIKIINGDDPEVTCWSDKAILDPDYPGLIKR